MTRRAMPPKHKVFLGSSGESKWLAREIEGSLQDFDTVEVDAWYHFGSWSAGASTLESLEHRLRECDFAVLVLSDDDLTQSRDNPLRPSPRDNVVFELGLFMGRFGRDRAFFFFPNTRDFKMPSDLYGITAFPYNLPDRQRAQQVVSPACTKIVRQIEEVARQQSAMGMQVRRRLELRVQFPQDHGRSSDRLDHLLSGEVSILKVLLAIDDDRVQDLRVYFDPQINLQKSTWTYREDEHGRYFWASGPQLEAMKEGNGFLGFDVDHPKKGKHDVTVVAVIDAQPHFKKRFEITVD